jgi:late competence protein required for DNA uptake (superfamily II DNA/RNA helicase)
MIEKIKHNVWVFFARVKRKKELKKLKQHLDDLSWHLGVEKMEEPELVKQYKDTELAIFITETMLKGLQYD